MYLLQSLQGHLYVVQSFIFSLKRTGNFAFLISQENIPHIFLGKGDISSLFQSTLRSFFSFVESNHFSDCIVSVQSERYLP